MALPIPPASFKTTLTNKIDETATTIKIDAVVDDDSNSLDTLELYFVLDKGKPTEEFIKGTVDAANSQLTSVTRDIDVLNPTSSTGTGSIHRKKASIEITAYPYLTLALRALNGTDEMGGVMQLPSSRTINTSRDVTDKEYVDAATASAGGITAFMTTDAGGLDIDVASGYYVTDDGIVEYAGVSGETMTDDATNYVMLDTDGTLVVNTTGWVASHVPLAKVVTASGDITSVTDARGWITSPSADRFVTDDVTYGATITAGEYVYANPSTGKWELADASSGSTAQGQIAYALDSGADTDTGKRVQTGGIITGLSGLTPGLQFVSDTAGEISSSAGTYRKLVGFAPTATTLILMPSFGPLQLDGANASATAANFNEAMTFIANTDITGAEAEALTDGSAIVPTQTTGHAHSGFTAGAHVRQLSTNARDEDTAIVGFSEDTTPYVSCIGGGNAGFTFGLATDYGVTPYYLDVRDWTAINASLLGSVRIDANDWMCYDSGGTTVIYKDGSSVTISGGSEPHEGAMSVDPTNDYLLVLVNAAAAATTTSLKRYSGIAGSTITYVDTITLDTAVSNRAGFLYDDENDEYICLDLSANLVRRFNSSGTTVDTAAYTVDDTYIKGLAMINDRVHLVALSSTGYSYSSGPTYDQGTSVDLTFIPTTMTRN